MGFGNNDIRGMIDRVTNGKACFILLQLLYCVHHLPNAGATFFFRGLTQLKKIFVVTRKEANLNWLRYSLSISNITQPARQYAIQNAAHKADKHTSLDTLK